MSNTTTRRNSVPDDATSIVVLPALSDCCEGTPAPLLHARPAPAGAAPAMRAADGATIADLSTRRQHRQFLFATNEPLSRVLNFVTNTRQGTSLFLFATNEQSPTATHHSTMTNRGLLIATRELLEIKLTHSKQTRKHFLIANVRPTGTSAPRSDFLIAGEKILKTALTPSVPTPSVSLIAGVSAPRTVRAASPHAPRFSALSSAASRSSRFGLHRSPAASRAAQIAICGSRITSHQALATTHQPGAQILHG
jgi:hypothetical protein